jgi:hypothetical protein
VYDPFTLASDLPVEAHFSKPVDAATVKLGQTVEVRDLGGGDGGTPVRGRLITGADWLKFIPDDPWQEGHPYALTLAAGDGGCGQSAICDLTGRPVNTDLLVEDPVEAEGGLPIQVPFNGGAPSGQGALALRVTPATDTNANGLLDLSVPLEQQRPENSVTLRDPMDGGSMVDRTYLSGTLLAEVGRFDPAKSELPMVIGLGSWLYGTSCNIFGITTDRLIIQPSAQQAGSLRAAPAGDGDQRPILTLPMRMYMHSVNATVEQALQREPLLMTLEGRLSFTGDGRMVAAMSNTNAVTLSMLQGRLTVLINPGDVQVRASSGVLGR